MIKSNLCELPTNLRKRLMTVGFLTGVQQLWSLRSSFIRLIRLSLAHDSQ